MKKTALITGASSGIGLELAKIHASKGDNLVLVARSTGKLEELKNELEPKDGVTVYIIGKDLSLPNAAAEVYAELKQKNMAIDYLINNAGFGDYGLYYNSVWEKQEQMINLNITALSHFTRLFLKDMVERKSGKIMNIASTASFQPGPTMAVYCASKAYVLSFSEAINNEVKEFGVTVTALCPGATTSGFQAAASLEGSNLFEGKKLPTSLEVAKYGYKSMMKGKAVAIHGFMNALMANSSRFSPRFLVVKIARMILEKKN
ncbi:MAG: SDR family oxidoreductase [Bacteroidales bacterium]|nr:MAG: SDR family oxidoreductase [Bacteroidales bacterium]